MADQNQSANVALTKNEILQNDLKKACELLGRYLLSNETLEAFMGPTHNRITITTDIILSGITLVNTIVPKIPKTLFDATSM